MAKMPFNPRAEQMRECRSLLLDFVNAVYPASIAQGQLIDVMLDLPDPLSEEYVLRDLDYLMQRKLVQAETPRHPVTGVRVKRWKLTADGVTFIERGKPWDTLEKLG